MDAAFTKEPSSQQAWLVSAGRVLASAEVAITRRSRRTGVIGRTDLDGAFVIPECNWIHTIGVKFPLDVAFLDCDGTVIKALTMGRLRVGAPVPHARMVIEARGGAFERWGLRVGDVVEIRPAEQSKQ